MHSLSAAGSWLPAVIDQRAALAALKYVSHQVRWSLRFTSWSPMSVAIEDRTELELAAQGIETSRFEDRARGYVADQVLQIVERMCERSLRYRRIDASLRDDAAAQSRKLDDLKSFILARIRNDLNQRGESLPDIWCGRVEDELFWQLPKNAGAIRSYLGMDQVVDPKPLRRGFNYVFKSMKFCVDMSATPHIKADPSKLKDVLDAREDHEPHVRARNLVYRAAGASLALLPAKELQDLESDEVVGLVQADVEARMKSAGCWGLIDLVIASDRDQRGLRLPPLDADADRLRGLIHEQDVRRCTGMHSDLAGAGE